MNDLSSSFHLELIFASYRLCFGAVKDSMKSQSKSPQVGSPRKVGARNIFLLCACIFVTVILSAQKRPVNRMSLIDPALPKYHPQPLPKPTNHGYIMPDGSIRIVGFEDMESIFSTGSGTGDVTNWSQIGVGGKLADKAIHPAGLFWDAYNRPEDPDMGEYMMYRKMGKFPGYVFSPNYEQFFRYSDVVRKVAEDPLAIGIIALNKLNPSVREVPMVGNDGHTFTTGSASDLMADRYPYGRDLFIYIRREPGTPFDPLVLEYMKLVLSKTGQEVVARYPKGYLPLSLTDVKAQMDKLDRAKTWTPRSKQGPMLNFPFPSPQP